MHAFLGVLSSQGFFPSFIDQEQCCPISSINCKLKFKENIESSRTFFFYGLTFMVNTARYIDGTIV